MNNISLLNRVFDDIFAKRILPLNCSEGEWDHVEATKQKFTYCKKMGDLFRLIHRGEGSKEFNKWSQEINYRSLSGSWIDHEDFHPFQITPIIFAIFRKNIPIVDILLDKHPELIDEQNNLRFTPLHFAAMLDDSMMYKHLQLHGASENVSGETLQPPQVAIFCQRREVFDSSAPFVGDMQMDKESFSTHFRNRRYTRTSHFETLAFIEVIRRKWLSDLNNKLKQEHLHRRCIPGMVDFYNHLRSQYSRLTEKIPAVYANILESGPLEGQWNIRAREEIQPGECITEYAGVIKSVRWAGYDGSEHSLMSTLLLESSADEKGLSEGLFIDASNEAGGIAELVNHGYPNISALNIVDDAGIVRVVYFSLRKIQPGENLTINYGKNYFKNLGIEPLQINHKVLHDYLEETRGLTYFDCVKISGITHLVKIEQDLKFEFGFKVSPITSESVTNAHAVQKLMHQSMLDYLIDFPSDLNEDQRKALENIQQLKKELEEQKEIITSDEPFLFPKVMTLID